jgi:hypothetical protein
MAFDSPFIVIELLHLRKRGLHQFPKKADEEILVPDPEVRIVLRRAVFANFEIEGHQATS